MGMLTVMTSKVSDKKVKKLVCGVIMVFLITCFLEIFVFNFSSFRTMNSSAMPIADNFSVNGGESVATEVYTVNGPVRNVYAHIDVENGDEAYVSVWMTDAGNKYEYGTPEFVVCNGSFRSRFSNVYPFGDVKNIYVIVRAADGTVAHVKDITINRRVPFDIKPLRALVIFFVLTLGYLIFTDSFIHDVYFEHGNKRQIAVTLVAMFLIMALGRLLNTADTALVQNPYWPHHKQYQELAHSLKEGSVILTEKEVDERLLEVENPYDTITLQAEGIPYAMDYAYYEGHYYAYFGIVPELLLYYPYYLLTGRDFPNYMAIYAFFLVFVAGAFLLVTGLVRKYSKRMPYLLYLLLCVAVSLTANFVFLVARPDIYDVPIIGGIGFSFAGIGLWLEALNTNRLWLKRLSITLGSLFVALVAGCRPQLVLLSGVAVILFLFDEGLGKRKLFTRKSVVETVLFFLPIIAVAIPVCWYNAARFGNILDFGATYSLTSNDMNNRGFNFDRLFRSLYYFLFQPPVVNADYPFIHSTDLSGDYMGRLLYEYNYGGIFVANAFMFSIWVALIKRCRDIQGSLKGLVVYLMIVGLIIAGFDANGAGIIYRYTCDFAPAFVLAAALLWIVFLDRSRGLIDYTFASRFFYVCFVLTLAYSFLTFVGSGSTVCLENDNKVLFNVIGDYFRF